MTKLDLSLVAEVAKLVSDWRLGRGPMQRRLADWLCEAIARGDLATGTQLPPERTLAMQLGVSRTTVMGAYDLLREDGWIRSRRGSGTFVAVPKGAEGQRDQLVAQLARNPLFRGRVESAATNIDFISAAPDAASPVAQAVRLAVSDLEVHLRGSGYSTAGLPTLRRAIASHLTTSALPTTEDEVLVTTGSQQAISLLATLYLEPTDPVVVEKPTYPGALDAFRSAGARLFAVTIGEHGVRPDDLRQMLGRTHARLAYITPTFNNPTGAVVPLEMRRELAKVAVDFQATLIEDHALADVVLEGDYPQQPISTFAPDGGVVLIGSLSKLFWGGLRVGWIRAPRSAISRLTRIKAVADIASSLLSQLVAVRLLPLVEEVKAARRQQMSARLDQLTSLVEELLPSWQWTRPAGGLSLWIRLPEGNATDFAEFALRFGVAVAPGPHFSPDESCQDYLRIPFTLDPGRIESGVRRLARAWAAYTPISGQARTHVHRAIV